MQIARAHTHARTFGVPRIYLSGHRNGSSALIYCLWVGDALSVRLIDFNGTMRKMVSITVKKYAIFHIANGKQNAQVNYYIECLGL